MLDYGIYNMDCREGLKLIDDNTIDIVMTDIPYDISQRKTIDRTAIDNRALHREGKKKDLNFNFGEWDFFSDKAEFFNFINEVFTDVYRVMKDSASFYMWCPKSEVSFIEYILKDIGYHVRSTLVWCKTNPCPQIFKVGYMSSTEFCIFATKHKGAKHYWNIDRGQKQSYWVTPICQGTERTDHPTQKRLDIAEDMIAQSARRGEVLLDCFAGSGTFAIASHNLGLNYIAFERDENIYKMAKERIERETSQMNIYDFM
jgi:DNA modification methylase